MNEKLVIELHYEDGDVGAYDTDELEDIATDELRKVWDMFSKGKNHVASHIVIRKAE